jgi:hypothetical protein
LLVKFSTRFGNHRGKDMKERPTATIITSCSRGVFSMRDGYCVGCGILTWVGGAFNSETVFADGELFIVSSRVNVDCIAS